MIIKVCGMREADNILDVEHLDIDWMGFIFYGGSSRYVATRPSHLPALCKKVGVFVNSSSEVIKSRLKTYGLDLIQLHGRETPGLCKMLKSSLPFGTGLIKAIQIKDKEDFIKADAYAPFIDYFLFETRCDSYGGSGQKFDWNLLDNYNSEKPFILTGGIGPEDAQSILNIHNPHFAGIDLNSGFELRPAYKDVRLLEKFIYQIRHHITTNQDKQP